VSSGKSTVINVIASSGLACSFKLPAEATDGTGIRTRNDSVASGKQLGYNSVITMPNSLSNMWLDISMFDAFSILFSQAYAPSSLRTLCLV